MAERGAVRKYDDVVPSVVPAVYARRSRRLIPCTLSDHVGADHESIASARKADGRTKLLLPSLARYDCDTYRVRRLAPSARVRETSIDWLVTTAGLRSGGTSVNVFDAPSV